MAFCQSFMFSTYSSKEVYPSPLVDDLYLSNLVNLDLLAESSMMPSLMFLPNFSQNSMYGSLDSSSSSSSPSSASSSSSSSSSASDFCANLRNISRALRTSFLPITFKTLCCWSVSRETLSGRSSESTTPRRKFKYRGTKSSNSSVMSTLRTYNRNWAFLLWYESYMSKGTWPGTKRMDLNSTSPSALKWIHVVGSAVSLENVL